METVERHVYVISGSNLRQKEIAARRMGMLMITGSRRKAILIPATK